MEEKKSYSINGKVEISTEEYRDLIYDKYEAEAAKDRYMRDGWKKDEDLGRAWWRFDFPDCAVIVEEQLRTTTWPDEHVAWYVVHWYIVEDWMKPFADSVASRSLALAKLKDEQKKRESSES